MTDLDDGLVAALRDRAGDHLRVVGTYDDDTWHIAYIRADLRDVYATDSVDDIADDLVFDALGVDQQESLYELGDLRATVRLFDEGLVVHVPVGDHDGYLVSLDESADLRAREVVELVRDTAA